MATLLHDHYEAFRREVGQPPTIIYAPWQVVGAWMDFPVNVVPSGDKVFRGVVLRKWLKAETETACYSPLK